MLVIPPGAPPCVSEASKKQLSILLRGEYEPSLFLMEARQVSSCTEQIDRVNKNVLSCLSNLHHPLNLIWTWYYYRKWRHSFSYTRTERLIVRTPERKLASPVYFPKIISRNQRDVRVCVWGKISNTGEKIIHKYRHIIFKRNLCMCTFVNANANAKKHHLFERKLPSQTGNL